MKCIVRKIETLEPAKINSEDNLTSEERKALHDLKMNKNIIIKPADKGSSIVIMNVEYYRDKLVMEGHLQTNAYKKCDNNIDNKVKAKLDILIDKYSHCLTQNEKDCIKNYQWKTSQLLEVNQRSEIVLSWTSNIDYKLDICWTSKSDLCWTSIGRPAED